MQWLIENLALDALIKTRKLTRIRCSGNGTYMVSIQCISEKIDLYSFSTQPTWCSCITHIFLLKQSITTLCVDHWWVIVLKQVLKENKHVHLYLQVDNRRMVHYKLVVMDYYSWNMDLIASHLVHQYHNTPIPTDVGYVTCL